MEELYKMIEERIAASGFPGKIDGEEFYQDISAEVDEKEPGEYIFTINKDEGLIYQGGMSVMEDEFDLHYVDIITKIEKYHVDFD